MKKAEPLQKSKEVKTKEVKSTEVQSTEVKEVLTQVTPLSVKTIVEANAIAGRKISHTISDLKTNLSKTNPDIEAVSAGLDLIHLFTKGLITE